jgi:glycosyltransferase involved in cell wall biosynthesis
VKQLVRTLYLRWFYRHIDAFCYVGEEARQHLLRAGVPASRMFFAPYSVDNSLFESQRQAFGRAETRAALGIADDHLVLLLSGKLIPRKAPLLLTGALQQLRTLDKVVLLVVGEGVLRPRIEAEGRALLGDRFHLHGFVNQSEIGRYYTAADVLVLPSRYETWGLVVNEAMQFGVPAIVSSKVGCHRDLIVEGTTGMVFADGNERALARCLERFLGEPGLARRLGDAARVHIAAYSTEASAAGIRRALGLK